MNWCWRLLQEPLLHFVILAIGLFVAARWWNPNTTMGTDAIVVSRAQIENLAVMWARTWQRPPTPEELQGLIDDYVREEVYYREAQRMELDRDDTIIRRRLRQKMEFLAENMADAVAPTDEQLQPFLEEHPERFAVERTVTFRHVYLKPDRRPDTLQKDVEALLAELNSLSDPAESLELGDRFLLPYEYDDASEREIASVFGNEFPQQLRKAEVGRWSGPYRSGYGLHLVWLDDRTAGRIPELSEIRDAVAREWLADRRQKSKAEFYQQLRDKYRVVVDWPEPSDESANEGSAAEQSAAEKSAAEKSATEEPAVEEPAAGEATR